MYIYTFLTVSRYMYLDTFEILLTIIFGEVPISNLSKK